MTFTDHDLADLLEFKENIKGCIACNGIGYLLNTEKRAYIECQRCGCTGSPKKVGALRLWFTDSLKEHLSDD